MIDVGNGDYARKYFPKQHWSVGHTSISLADFDWDEANSLMYYGGLEIEYGKEPSRPMEIYCNPTRLYGVSELNALFDGIGMKYKRGYGNFDMRTDATSDVFQIQVVAEKI